MRKIIFLSFIVAISLSLSAQQQEIPGVKKYANRFGDKDKISIDAQNGAILDALTRISTAQKEEKSLQKYFARKNKKKAEKKSVPLKKKWIAAYKIYMDAVNSVYDIYNTWLNDIEIDDPKVRQEVMTHAANAEVKNSKSRDLFGRYIKSVSSDKILKKEVKYQKMKVDLKTSADNMIDALKEMEQALDIAFKYQEVDAKDNKAWNEALTQNTFEAYVNYIKNFPTGLHIDEAKAKIKAIKAKIAAERKQMEKYNAEIEYRVQLVAVSKKLSTWKKKRLYSDYKSIEEELDPIDGLYKYYVGHFKHYKEAKKFVGGLGIADAFVVSYKNGQKAPILEVLDIENHKKEK